jgi:hypothetical protein
LPGDSSGNERVEQQISIPRTSSSASWNRGPHDGLPRFSIQYPVGNPHPSYRWQRQESILVFERTTSEREEPKVMRSSRRSSNHETDNHQAEEEARPQGRPIFSSNTEYVDERLRHRIPDKTISDHPPASNVYHESLREKRRSTSRSKLPSLSGNSGTDVTTNTNRNTTSVHEPPVSRRANVNSESRLAPSLNCDHYSPEGSQTTSRSRLPSFSQGSDVYVTINTSRNTNNRTVLVDEPSTPRRSHRITKSRPSMLTDLDLEQPQRGRQTSTRSSLSSDNSGVGMSKSLSSSSDFVPESPASRRYNREANKNPPISGKFDEERAGRHAIPSTSRSSSTGGDSSVFMPSSLSGSEDFAPESSAYRRPNRVEDRYYPATSNKYDEKRRRRRTRSSRN